jgi:spermidine/putrescine transport system substrate-binding protein
MKRFFYNSAIVVFWIAIFFAFLSTPSITRYFKQDTLNVFTWAGLSDPAIFKKFEQETGIAVNVSYFGSNEELIVKLLATQAEGYDLIIPSDYAIQFLKEHDLLQKLDKSQLPCLNRIDPVFLGHYYDKNNDYSIPLEWYVLGFGINKKYYKKTPVASWSAVFDPVHLEGERLGIINDCRDLIGLTIFYLYKTFRSVNKNEITEIIKVLKNQKKYAEAYTDFRGDFLLESGNASIVIMANSFALKSMKHNPDIEFVLPEEGTFLQTENCVIPKKSTKKDAVHKLINFLFRPDIQRQNFEHATSLTTTKDAQFLYDEPLIAQTLKYLHRLSHRSICLFQNFLTDDQVNTIWLSFKSRS